MRHLWIVMINCVLCLLAVQRAAAVEVVTVPAADVVVVEVMSVPVAFSLAHVALPDDAELQAQGAALLKELVEGKSVKLKYEDDFGAAAGTGRVHVLKSLKSVNVKLVEAGFARYAAAGDDGNKYAQQMIAAEASAKSAKKGLWAKDQTAKEAPAVAARPKDEPKPQSKKPATEKSMRASAKFVAELSGKYYYPVSSSQADKLNKRKIVYYKTEKEAVSAGKKKAEKQSTKKVAQTMENADALMAEGREHYSKAVDMDVSDARDKHYGEAFRILTQAMLIYRAFYEKDENNAELGETLRVCMEMRYGAMKNKRP